MPRAGDPGSPSGVKTFVLGASHNNNFVRLKLGQAGHLTLAQAREKANKWLALIKQGRDPQVEEERQRREEALAAGNTFGAVAEDFIKRHLKGKRQAVVVEREIRTELISDWGERPLSEITRREIIALVEKINDRGTTGAHAHNILGHVRRIFSFACDRDILDTSPCDRIKPAKILGRRFEPVSSTTTN